MIELHRALLEWLLAGTPPGLWNLICFHPDINPPHLAHTGPYTRQNITATTSLPAENQRCPERKSRGTPEWAVASATTLPRHETQFASSSSNAHLSPSGRPTGPHAVPEAHRPPPQGTTPARGPTDDPTSPAPHLHETLSRSGPPSSFHPNPDPSPEWAPLSPASLYTTNGGILKGPLLSSGAIRIRSAWTKRRETTRRHTNHAKSQSLITEHWPPLRPPALPIPSQMRALLPLLMGSLDTFGWRPYLEYIIRYDPPILED